MAKLPFVVEPRLKPILEQIGSEESGKIQIERRGYLTSGEKAFFQQAKQSDQGTSGLINLSRKISRATGLDMTKSYEAVVRVISGAQGEEIDKVIENDFADELSGVLRDLTNGQTHDEILMSICLIKYRIDPSFDIEGIMEVHPDIVSGLAELYRQEEAKSTDRLVDAIKDESEGVEKVAKKPTSKAKPMI
jgi:hypothetical protein